MPDLAALRARAGELLDRRRAVAADLADLSTVRIPIEPALIAEWADPEDDYERHAAALQAALRDRGDLPLFPTTARHDLPLFSREGLYYLLGAPKDDRSDEFVRSGNLAHAFERMAKLAGMGEDVGGGAEPDLSSLSPFERRAIVAAYVGLIEGVTFRLRDIGTMVRQCRTARARMSDGLRHRCLGMFGGADGNTAHRYSESDFGHRGIDYVDGKSVHRHPEVLGERYLAAYLGDAEAARVAAALARIEAATEPRPGEPELLRHFSSHQSNFIRVEFAPDEVDPEVDPARAPRP